MNPTELKRGYSKFFTPAETAKYMVKILDPKYGDYVLEPSAGDGALIKALRKYKSKVFIHAVELNPIHESVLDDLADYCNIQDFLSFNILDHFDSCITNPPFGNGIDLNAHFDKIHELVKYKGRVVAIVPYDFNPRFLFSNYTVYPLENWATNSDGTKTEIKIIEFLNGL